MPPIEPPTTASSFSTPRRSSSAACASTMSSIGDEREARAVRACRWRGRASRGRSCPSSHRARCCRSRSSGRCRWPWPGPTMTSHQPGFSAPRLSDARGNVRVAGERVADQDGVGCRSRRARRTSRTRCRRARAGGPTRGRGRPAASTPVVPTPAARRPPRRRVSVPTRATPSPAPARGRRGCPRCSRCRPTSRTKSSPIPAFTSSSSESCEWVVDAGWMISDFASPTLARCENSSTPSMSVLPASRPPFTPKTTTPP